MLPLMVSQGLFVNGLRQANSVGLLKGMGLKIIFNKAE
jgi:hypothetical protein